MLLDALNGLHDQTDLVFACLSSLDNLRLTAAFFDTGVSRHLRHMHDHERAVFHSLSSGVVDYNRRRRNDAGERDMQTTIDTSQRLRQGWLNADLSDRPVVIHSEISVTQNQTLALQSTLWRELMYMIHHNIHHLAYIKLLLDQQGIDLPASLGRAPATATHCRQLEATVSSEGVSANNSFE
ncbi:MAG: hypothetical protein ABJ000_15135 [Saccharospirillum sp.]|uniref:hypothetical protein n=1 Tax=Saccharospirillum sp. TaxID=2033801 RepID=UPI003298FCBF